jgi:hypothetical protein
MEMKSRQQDQRGNTQLRAGNSFGHRGGAAQQRALDASKNELPTKRVGDGIELAEGMNRSDSKSSPTGCPRLRTGSRSVLGVRELSSRL